MGKSDGEQKWDLEGKGVYRGVHEGMREKDDGEKTGDECGVQ